MKRIVLTITVLFISMFQMLAQTPEAINYQSIIKNAEGEIIADQNVSFRISILEGGVGGISVYTETHNVTTNNVGMIGLLIGGGNVVAGDFQL